MEQTQYYQQIIEKLDKIYFLVLAIPSSLNKKPSTPKSKFDEAVDYIKNLSQINIHVSRAADLIFPKIYSQRPRAVDAIKQMVSSGILKQQGEFITKVNTS